MERGFWWERVKQQLAVGSWQISYYGLQGLNAKC